MVILSIIKETYHNTAIINTADNCRTGASSLRKRNTSGMESQVAVVVGEIEAAHGDGVAVYAWGRPVI